MQYLLMIYEDEKIQAGQSEKEKTAIFDEYNQFTQSIIGSGHFKGGEALHPVNTAKTLRVRNGEVVTTDGPFAETREQLGGFYLVEATNIEEALGIAKRLPSARTGSIEVRPVMKFG